MSTPEPPYDPSHPPREVRRPPFGDARGDDVLGDVLPASSPERRRGRRGLVVGVALAVLGVTGAGVAAAFALSGGGTQPEDVLPADALAFVKIDLDPPAGQKLNVYRLSKRFPETADGFAGADSLRDDVLRLAFESSSTDYDRDVKPWIGNRAGLAVLPSGGDQPAVVLALAYTDRDKAEKALRESKEQVEYAFVDGYVLLSDDADAVDAAAASQEHLSGQDAYTSAVEALDGDQLALAWVDAGRAWDAVPSEFRDKASQGSGLSGLDPHGQVVIGVHAESDAVEVTGRTIGVRTGPDDQDVLATGEGSGLAGDLPAEAAAALSIAAPDKTVGKAYENVREALGAFLPPGFEAEADELGLSLPDDLVTLLGSETAVGAWGEADSPEVLVRTRSQDPAGAADLLNRLYEAAGGLVIGPPLEDYLQLRADGLAVGSPGALAADGDTLSDRDEFTAAVPDAAGAGLVLWVSVQDLLRVTGSAPSADTDPLGAFGLTADGGADGVFRARLTFR